VIVLVCFVTVEIVRAVTTWSTSKGVDIKVLLNTPLSQLESDCLNRALIAAVNTNNPILVGELVLRGADNVKDALIYSKSERKIQSTAMLLLLVAVTTDDNFLLTQLFDNGPINHPLLANSPVTKVRHIVASDTEFLNIPIEIARQKENVMVFHNLLLHSRVTKCSKIDWHGHNLSNVDSVLFLEIPWVRHLILASTKLSEISDSFYSCLLLCTILELQENSIKSLPGGIFELPCIKEINSSHNHLEEIVITGTGRWSDSLDLVNLSNNMLTELPSSINAPYLKYLDISCNQFAEIPNCVKGFKLLQSLNISFNSGITKLSVSLACLKHLTNLEMEGLTNIIEPPPNKMASFESCLRYLKDKLEHGSPFYHLRLMVMGPPGVGKTTLVGHLADTKLAASDRKDVVVSSWKYVPSNEITIHHYTIWDVPGRLVYQPIVRLYYKQRTLYILLWDITDGTDGIMQLHKTMCDLSVHAPGCSAIILATFLDQLTTEERDAGVIQHLLQQAAVFTKQFPLVTVTHITAVALQGRLENLSKLKKYIYQSAEKFTINGTHVMGQVISSNHHILSQHLSHLSKLTLSGVRTGYMSKKDFVDIQVHSIKKLHLHDIDDTTDILNFFCQGGFLFHSDGLYIFHPSWLFKTILPLMVGHHDSSLVKHGVVRMSDLVSILENKQITNDKLLSLIQTLCIALPIDGQKNLFLLPHLLPDTKTSDSGFDISILRYFTFKQTISGRFWKQLLAYLIFTIPVIKHGLAALMPKEWKGILGVSPNFSTPLILWKDGLIYETGDIQLRVELIKPSNGHNGLEKVMVCTSSAKKSIQMFCQIIGAISNLIKQNFPNVSGDVMEQYVSCLKCLEAGEGNASHHILDQQLLSSARNNISYIMCSQKVHNLALNSLIPEYFLLDFKPSLLEPDEVQCNKSSQLACNTNCSIYSGTLKKRNAAVLCYNVQQWSMKLYILRHEVRLLLSLNHSCILSFLGCSLQPKPSLVFEHPPSLTLDAALISSKISIPRVILYRIAIQVASVLNYLHSKGLALGDLSVSSILLWSLDPDDLINCKLFGFSSAGYTSYTNSSEHNSLLIPDINRPSTSFIYNPKADIFLYSFILYWLVTRHAPFHNLAKQKIMGVLLNGSRPSIDSIVATAGLCAMTQAMKQCWRDQPDERPAAVALIQDLGSVSVQLLMGVHHINSGLSLRNVCPVVDSLQSLKQLWLCYDANEGLDLIVCNPKTLDKESSHSVPLKQICTIHQCVDTVWVASRFGLETGSVDIYSIHPTVHRHSLTLCDQSVCSIASTESHVYLGTYEGSCFIFPSDINKISSNPSEHQQQFLSDYSIQGLVVANKSLWAGANDTIFILNLKTLEITNRLHRTTKNRMMPIGQLKLTPDERKIVSAHMGGSHFSVWDVATYSHVCDVNVLECTRLLKLNSITLLSAMIPVLDTVWIGMESGLIMVFSLENPRLLVYFQPYESYIRFLSCVKGPGVCGSEQYMILCGGKSYCASTLKNVKATREKSGAPKKESFGDRDPGTVTVWEAVSTSRLLQMQRLSSGDAWTRQEITPNPPLTPIIHEEHYGSLISFSSSSPSMSERSSLNFDQINEQSSEETESNSTSA